MSTPYGPNGPYGAGPPGWPPPGGPPGPPPGGPPPGQPYPPPWGDPTDCVGTRVGQYLLDGLVSSVVVFVAFALLALVGYLGVVGDASVLVALAYVVAIAAAIATPWFVLAYWPSTHQGQTPAMGWLNLRIVNQDGSGVPGLGALTIRWLLFVVDGIFGGLVGLVIMQSNPRHQRLGDMAAGTLVVRA